MTYTSALLPLAGVLVCVGTYLALSKDHKDVVWSRLGLERRPSRPSTPTIEKQLPSTSSKPLASSASDLSSAFPPRQREQLVTMKPGLPRAQQAALGNLEFDNAQFRSSLLAFDEDYRTADDSRYCYSGYSVREIKALGDFPDYAALSDVPLPQPYHEFDIDKAKPRPYRPFRWAYHQTMSLSKLETDWWIELESTYKERIAQRQALYAEHGEAVLQWLPGSELACKELMEMVVQFLCARYPQYFSMSADGSRLENAILGTASVFADRHPLLVLLDNVPEDFALTLRDPATGHYHFRAGVICSSLGWNVATKIGMRLDEIHSIIPDYKEKMQFSMDRFFSKMPPSKPIQRGSWGLEVDQPLYMPAGHPHEEYRLRQDERVTRDRVFLRVDWQTLRRLPLSGSIVFNFKALFTPVGELRDEARVPSLLLQILRGGKESLMKYKNTWHTEHVAVPMLEEYEREQREKGVVEADWVPQTLDQTPWFEGWEEKWHAQQGF